jgi:hypothetical protein
MSNTPTPAAPANTSPAPRRLTLRRESLRELTADTLRRIAGGFISSGRGDACSDATVKYDVKVLAA